jgi:hypothetical protein
MPCFPNDAKWICRFWLFCFVVAVHKSWQVGFCFQCGRTSSHWTNPPSASTLYSAQNNRPALTWSHESLSTGRHPNEKPTWRRDRLPSLRSGLGPASWADKTPGRNLKCLWPKRAGRQSRALTTSERQRGTLGGRGLEKGRFELCLWILPNPCLTSEPHT